MIAKYNLKLLTRDYAWYIHGIIDAIHITYDKVP